MEIFKLPLVASGIERFEELAVSRCLLSPVMNSSKNRLALELKFARIQRGRVRDWPLCYVILSIVTICFTQVCMLRVFEGRYIDGLDCELCFSTKHAHPSPVNGGTEI